MLDVIAPPYTSDFVQLFLPILENDSIAGTIRTEGEHDPVAEFIGKYTNNKNMQHPDEVRDSKRNKNELRHTQKIGRKCFFIHEHEQYN